MATMLTVRERICINKGNKHFKWVDLIGIFLIIVSIIQFRNVFNQDAWIWLKRVVKSSSLSAVDRSGLFYFGAGGNAYLHFLNDIIPDGKTLIIPENSSTQFSSQSILKFFLISRPVVSCRCNQLGAGCYPCLREPDTYIPAIGKFPPIEAVAGYKKFIPYSNNSGFYKGIYIPLNASEDSLSTVVRESVYHPFTAFFIDLVVLFSLGVLGYSLAKLVLPRISGLEAFGLSIPLGVGLMTWFLFLASWVGIPLVLATVILIYLVLLGLLLIIRWVVEGAFLLGPRMFRIPEIPLKKVPIRASIIPALGLLVVFVILMVISVGRSYSKFDDMAIWSLKGYGIAYKGTIFASGYLGGHGLAYPLNISLAISTFKMASGDVLPGSKSLFPIFMFGLFTSCFQFLKRRGVGEFLALSGLLFIITVPVIFQYATYGFVNLPFACYLVMGIIWCLEGFLNGDSRAFLLSGILFAFAGWTRSEGILFALVFVISLIGAEWFVHRRTLHSLWMFLPVAAIPGVWLFFARNYIKSDQAGRSLSAIYQTMLSRSELGNPVMATIKFGESNLRNTQIWGYAILVLSALITFGLIKVVIPLLFEWMRKGNKPIFGTPDFRRRSPETTRLIAWPLLVATISSIIVPLVLFTVESAAEANFATFLSVSFDRAYFPAFFLAVIFCMVWAGAWDGGNVGDRTNKLTTSKNREEA